MTNQTLKNRVGFFRRWDFYSPMQDPIYSQLKHSLPCCMTSDLKEMIEFRPDIIVLSDHHGGYFYKYIPNALIIMTRHGCVSKNYISTSMAWYDIFCVSSEWVREDCIKKGMKPQIGYFVSGFPPMDQVFESLKQPANSFRTEIFPDDGPTLLYAPTWNPTLNSADILNRFKHVWNPWDK